MAQKHTNSMVLFRTMWQSKRRAVTLRNEWGCFCSSVKEKADQRRNIYQHLHPDLTHSTEVKGQASYLLLYWSTQRAGGLYNMSVGQRLSLEPADVQTNWQMKAAYCTVQSVVQYVTLLSHDLLIIREINHYFTFKRLNFCQSDQMS